MNSPIDAILEVLGDAFLDAIWPGATRETIANLYLATGLIFGAFVLVRGFRAQRRRMRAEDAEREGQQ